MPESRVDAGINFDVTQLTEGSAQTVEGLKSIADQAEVTSSTMVTKSQAMAEAAKEAASQVTAGDLRMAESARALSLAKKEQSAVAKDTAKGIVSETDALALNARAMAVTRAAQAQFAEAQQAVAAEAAEAAEAVNLSSIAWVAAFQRIALSAKESFTQVQEMMAGTAERAGITAQGIRFGFSGLSELLGGALVVGFGAEFLDSLAKINNELDHLSEKTGINITSLAGLEQIVKGMGADWDPIANGMVRLSRAQVESVQGAKEQRTAFTDLGITMDEVRNSSPEQLFYRVATAMSAETNTAVTANSALMLFGRGGQALIPIMKEQGAQLEANMKTQGAATGITNESAAAARRWTEDMAKLTAELRSRLMPALEYLPDVIRGVVGVFQIAWAVIESVAAAAIAPVLAMVRAVTGLGKVLYDIARGNFSAIVGDSEAAGDAVKKVWSDTAEEIGNSWKRVGETFTGKSPTFARVDTGSSGDIPDDAKPSKPPKEAKEKPDKGPQGATVTAQADAEVQPIPPDLSGVVNAYVKAGEAEVRANDETQRQLLEAFRSSREEEARLASDKYSDLEQQTAREVEQGRMTAAQRLAILVKGLQDERDARLSAMAALEAVDAGNPEKLQQDENQKLEIERQYQKQFAQLQQQAGTAMAAPYLKAFDQINSGWLKVQTDLIAGNAHIGRDFAKMGLGMVQSMAANFEKMLVSQVQFEIRKIALHRATVIANNATDASGAAASQATAKASDSAQGIDAAKLAFKNTYKVVSGWPVVGPILAPVLAAGAFAAVAAFEQGGIVSGSTGMAVPILAHAGERVLTPSQTTNFERVVNNNSTGGGDVHNHFGGNNFSQAGSDFKSQWNAHEKHIQTSLKRMHREGKLKMA